jgi:hypothetical protein
VVEFQTGAFFIKNDAPDSFVFNALSIQDNREAGLEIVASSNIVSTSWLNDFY